MTRGDGRWVQAWWNPWVGVVAAGAVICIGASTRALQQMHTVAVSRSVGGRSLGHPTADEIMLHPPQPAPSAAALGAVEPVGGAEPEFELPASVLAPLATGEFVNFESPTVAPLAVSADGSTVFAVNTPNNRLVIIDATDRLQLVGDIFVGLEPVAVAIQPGTNDQRVWVANYISDTVAVVDVATRRLVDLIEVGDEPINIVFNPAGTHAFVIIEGSPHRADSAAPTGSPFVELGHVVTIDTATRRVVSTTFLDCNTPRAAAYDALHDRLVVAAHHSGNNTTVVGQPVELEFQTLPPVDGPPEVAPPAGGRGCGFPDPCAADPTCNCVSIPNLWVAQQFSATAGVFDPNGGAAGELSPWPDDEGTNGAPLVPRIVPDDQGDWHTIVHDILTDDSGQPDPAMVTQMNAEFGIRNGAAVIAQLHNDAKNTRDRDLVIVDAHDPANPAGLPEVGVVPHVGTTLNGVAINPGSGVIWVSHTEALNTMRLVANLQGRFLDHRIALVDASNLADPVVVAVDLHAGVPNFDDVSAPNPVARAASLAHPQGLAFDAAGDRVAVVSKGMDRIGILDGATGAMLSRVNVPAGPRGLVWDAVNDRLYAWSRHALVLSSIDVSSPGSPVMYDRLAIFNPEPRMIRDGRRFHYSTALSNNGAHSCDSCHPNTDFDRLAWDLGHNGPATQPAPPNLPGLFNHPLKGPMVTQSLRGLDRHEPLHWRGDKPVFQDFNEAFANLLGGEELSDADMDRFDAFIKTVVYPPNPYFKRTNAFKEPRAFDGMVQFVTSCNPCHQVIPSGPAGVGHDGAAFGVAGDEGMSLGGLFAQLQIVTQLRGVHEKFIGDLYNGFGMIHDGREEREANAHPLETFLLEFFPEELTGIGAQTRQDMIAGLNAFPTNVMNVVGWQIRVTGPTPGASALLADIDTMIAQYAKTPSHCDVVVQGTVQGVDHGYRLVSVPVGESPVFEADTGELQTLAELLAGLTSGDQLVVVAVPPGSGKRIGVDQDTDGLLDGLDPDPQHDHTGDFDLDGDVDLADAAVLQACFTGAAGNLVSPGCQLGDADEDGDVDDADHAAFVALWRGPGR